MSNTVFILPKFETLSLRLLPSYKSIEVTLNYSQKENMIDDYLLNDLQKFCQWISKHLEIHALVLTSTEDYFSRGFNWKELKQKNEQDIFSFIEKFKQVLLHFHRLPQTIICDLKNETLNGAAELAAMADIRLGNHKTYIKLDHLKQGVIPITAGFLSTIINPVQLQSWILSSFEITSEKLFHSGFVDTLDKKILDYLENIKEQAPVSRLQLKQLMMNTSFSSLESNLDQGSEFMRGALKTRDFQTTPSFISAKEWSKQLKSSIHLIKKPIMVN